MRNGNSILGLAKEFGQEAKTFVRKEFTREDYVRDLGRASSKALPLLRNADDLA